MGTRSNGGKVNNINYNGVNYTTQQIQEATNGSAVQSLWAMPLGDVTGGGITGDLTITFSGTGGTHGGIAASFSNVNQTTPMDGNASNTGISSGNNQFYSLLVGTGLSGNMAIDFIGAGGTPDFFPEGSGQVVLELNAPFNSSGANTLSMSYQLATDAFTSLGWNNSKTISSKIHLGNNIIAHQPALPVELTQFEANGFRWTV